MNDFEFICLLIEKYIIGHKLDYVTAKKIMIENGMTEDECSDLGNAVYRMGKGRNGWPEFVISAVRNSNEVLK